MNYLWAFMILTGIIYGAFHGTLPQITTAALDSAKEAVTLCITMMGVMSFWVGLMRIAEKAGIIEGLSRKMRPVLHFPVSGSPAGAPRQRIHCDEYDCKCLRTWLGGNAGGIKSDGGIAGA